MLIAISQHPAKQDVSALINAANTTCAPSQILDISARERLALQTYNLLLTDLNKSTDTSANNRISALELYFAGGRDTDINALANALKSLYGHWVNGEDPKQVLRKIIIRLDQGEADSLCGIVRYNSSINKIISNTLVRIRNKGMCLVHPERDALSRGLCRSCYSKAFRLNILHLITNDLDKFLIKILRSRKPCANGQCVNCSSSPAYDTDGLCVECMRRVKKASESLSHPLGRA